MNKEEKTEIKKEKKLVKQAAKLKKLEEKGLKKAKGFVSDFKQFATKGNVIDMAIGVIIANAFTKIVNSLVNDVITPAISILTGKIDYTNLFVALDGNTYATLEEAKAAGVSVISYGTFITNVVDFLMIALCLFIFFKVLFKARDKKKKEEVVEQVATTKQCPYCLNDVPLKATRCGHCTSMLEETVAKEK
ncbi:MAG: large conductance mechanosensitive channel protein MscL [Clostridia bacterium]|nr:large conductance mechanosensitive channel protein MscL [Clostridia bacterium]